MNMAMYYEYGYVHCKEGINSYLNIQNIDKPYIYILYNNNNIQWDQLNKNKKEILNLVSWEEFKNKI